MAEQPNWNRAGALVIRGIIERMGLCSCGTNAHWEIILFLLERGENQKFDGKFYAAAEDASERWIEFSLKVLDSFGLFEHGGTVCGGWLTDKGKLLLRFLRDFGLEGWDINNEPNTHPLWSVECGWEAIAKPNDAFSEWEASTKATNCGGKPKAEALDGSCENGRELAR